MNLPPTEIAHNVMYNHDKFSQLLGMKIIEISQGICTVQLKVTDEMTNGFNIAHGGITYSLADSAFAFACNSFGYIAVSIETSISHNSKVFIGDELFAHATLIHKSRSLGRYAVKVVNQKDKLVADFKGTCFITDHKHSNGKNL